MGYYTLSVGKEVDISLVRKSPVASWTRGALMTLTGAKGQQCPGARFLGFFLFGLPTLAVQLWRTTRWR